MQLSSIPASPIVVGDVVEHVLTGEKVSHIVKEIDADDDASVRTVCYAFYHLALTVYSTLPVCEFCKTGAPDPNQLSDAIVAEPGFAETYPALAAAHSLGTPGSKPRADDRY